MLLLYINDVDRTDDVENNTIAISNQIQQRVDTLSFSLFNGNKPLENQDIQLYRYDTLAGVAGTTLTLSGLFELNVNYFYADQTLYIRIGDADEEKVEVLSYNEDTLTLILKEAPSGTVSIGDKIGVKIFGGTISRVKDRNVEVLQNIEYDIECVDYTRMFDKKNISDTWTDVDSRYIINSFVNTTVNLNNTLDDLSYATDNAIQAEWLRDSSFHSDLLGRYRFDEGSGVTAIDDSGNGLDASISGATYAAGYRNTGLDFDGVDNYVEVTNGQLPVANFQSGFTLSAIIRPDTAGENGFGRIIDKSTGTSGNNGFAFYVSSADRIFLEVNSGGSAASALGSVVIGDGNFYRVTATVTAAGVANLYVNGVLSGTADQATGACSGITTTNPLHFGERGSGTLNRAFDGVIDEVQLFDRVLTADEVALLDGNDAELATVNTADFIEDTASAVFEWDNVSNVAWWEGSPTSQDISDLVGASSGTPTKGDLMFWIDTADYTLISSLKIRVGSSASDYAELDFDVPENNDWNYRRSKFANATITGTPDWTAVVYVQVRIGATASSSVKMNGIRVNAENSFTLFQVAPTNDFSDIRSPAAKPISFMQSLAKAFEYVWFIDYDRDIYFQPSEQTPAPFQITDTSDNFKSLQIEADHSQSGNRIEVRGGEETSESTYAQVFRGDDTVREWKLKTKFKNLVLTVDDNSSTDTAGAGTTSTNLELTGHNLEVGDHLVNRTRDVVREVLVVVDVDNITVEEVPSQASGDTISFFDTAVTAGIEGIDDEASFDYMYNSNAESVRHSVSNTEFLTPSDYIRMEYNERVPIQLRYQDPISVAALRALGIGDGIIDLEPYIDRNITDRSTAIAIAQAKVGEFSNAVINGSLRTDWWGLQAGQLLHVEETINRNISEDYVIQTVTARQVSGKHGDYFNFNVKFGTTLMGWIEFMQKLLRVGESIELNVDNIVITFVSAYETVESSDVNQVAKDGGFKSVKNTETVESSDVNLAHVQTTGTWRYEPNGAGQVLESRYDLCDYA